jgi:small nuclear ribonucleoprotein B and B'
MVNVLFTSHSDQAISKNAKLLKLIHHRLRITVSDGRTLIGQLLAFDHHMNMVLGECE